MNQIENCALLGHYTTYSGNSLPAFRDNLSVPCSRVKNSKMKASYFYELCAVAHPATKFRGPSVQETIATATATATAYDYHKGKVKGKVFPVQTTKLYYRVDVQLQPFLTSTQDLSHYLTAARM